MALVFARTAVVPVWILIFGLVCLLSPPMGVGTGILLLVGGVLVAPIVMILLCAGIPRLFRRE
jgi:hypothetical protein